MSTGLVVLNWNNWRDTIECLESLGRVREPGFDVVVVDNGSTDGSRRILGRRFPELPLIATGENLGYAGGNNVGIRYWLERGKSAIGLVNNDVVVEPGFLAPLAQALEDDPALGLVAPLILSHAEPEKVQCAGLDVRVRLGLTRFLGEGQPDRGQFDRTRRVDHLMGACLLVRREVFEKAGLFEESFFMYSEEIELAERAARAGYGAAVVGRSKVRHKGRATTDRVPGLFLYYATRNDILMRQRIASAQQWLAFAVLDLLVRLPRRLFALRGRPERRRLYLRAVRDGYAGRAGRADLLSDAMPATRSRGAR